MVARVAGATLVAGSYWGLCTRNVEYGSRSDDCQSGRRDEGVIISLDREIKD
jgi:hypothetical protein